MENRVGLGTRLSLYTVSATVYIAVSSDHVVNRCVDTDYDHFPGSLLVITSNL